MNRKYIIPAAALIVLLVAAVFMLRIFSGRILLPQTLMLGPVTLRYYGLIMVFAILAAYWTARKRMALYSIKPEDADELAFYALLAGFAGARLYHVLSDVQFYLKAPAEIIMIWHGGLSIYGAVLGGLAGAWAYYYVRMRKAGGLAKFLSIADWLTPGILLGQSIGRFGNFFNYELYGYPTALPWKMYVPLRFRPEQLYGSAFFHPLFLYEALANGLVLLFLLRRAKKSRFFRRPGTLFFSYLLSYNIVRFGLEFLRIDSVRLFGLRQNALVSLILVLIAAACLFYLSRHETPVSSHH